MRLAAPAQLRIGVDIVRRSRLYRDFSIHPEKIVRLTNRILHPQELARLNARWPGWQDIKSQSSHDQNRISEYLAGRWASKEAAKKAWGPHLLTFQDLRVEVEERGHGAVEMVCNPHRELSAPPPGAVLEQAGRLSISHDGEYAIATVLAAPLHSDILKELGRQKSEAEKKMRGQEFPTTDIPTI